MNIIFEFVKNLFAIGLASTLADYNIT